VGVVLLLDFIIIIIIKFHVINVIAFVKSPCSGSLV